METGTVVVALGLLLDVSGATLILVYGPSSGETLVRRASASRKPVQTRQKAVRAARMTRLGLILVLLGFLVPFAGVALQAFPLS